jgi:tetratricopeptide (TPR) repeat protein
MKNHCNSGLLSLVLLTLSSAAFCQTNAGVVSFANSGSKAAQAPFLHGVALLHSFEYDDAARDFREAEKMDPNFAMAYWGEVMTFNHTVWNQQNRDAALAALGKLGGTPEARLAKAPTEREKDYLRTLDVLYGEGPKATRDQLYAEAMAELHAKYPDDVEAAAFYGLALLGTGEGVRNERTYMQAAAILMPLYYSHPDHPGIAHYLIHSCDDPIHAGLALPAARSYSKIAPDAAHAQHMTSHIFLALGMWSDVVQANEAATRVVNEQRAAAGKAAVHCGHYNYWLEYGYLETGQIAKAKQIVEGCRADAAQAGMAAHSRSVVDPDDAALFSYLTMKTRFVVDTAQWDGEVAGWVLDPGENPLLRFAVDYEAGLIAAEKGDLSAAQKALSGMDSLLPMLPAVFDKAGEPADQPDRQVPGIERNQVQALILAAEGKLDEAVALARKTADAEMNLPFAFGPPDPVKPSYELLAELLMKQNQPREAEAALKLSLLRAPNRRQSVVLLERASAAGKGSSSTAMR